MELTGKLRITLAAIAVGLFAFITLGLIWFFFLGPQTPVGLGWYLFSFAAGLTMIVLPCTLPLAFVIVPLSLGRSAGKGLGIAIAFGLGVAITLSMYGVIAAIVGEVAIGTLGVPLEAVKNWLYFIAGALAYLFALGEIGLWKFRMPSYTGAAPAFIQRRQDYFKALLLGLFLGNIGVGCPHPATPVLLTRIAASGDVFYGWLLFFVHAVGRILPLLLLALLAILGVNALNWLISRREKIERATGWGMVFVAAFILVLGLFTHDWWVYSGQHTLLEEITQEERFLGIVAKRIGVAPPHSHGVPTGTGLLGLPLELGNWVLVGLFALPLWWFYVKKRLEIRDQRLEPEMRVQPYRFWLYLALTVLLALTFIWVLPDRFLNHIPHRASGMPAAAAVHREAGHEAEYHEEGEITAGLAVNLNVTPVPVLVGTSTRLDFFVNEKPGNVPVPAAELEIEHERLMHVIGVREDLNQFFHLHPQPTTTPGLLAVEHIFTQPGRYKIWSEVKRDGVGHAFGHPEFSVLGPGPRFEKQVSFGRNVIIGDYQVALKLEESVAKGQEYDLAFDIHTLTGDEVAVEEYLGADMHLSVIRDDFRQFIHTHPTAGGEQHGRVPAPAPSFINSASANGRDIPGAIPGGRGEDETITFSVTFPEAGLYKLFAQFRPKGSELGSESAILAEFWVRVAEPVPITNSRIFLTAASLLAIAILSWAVRRYLKPRGA